VPIFHFKLPEGGGKIFLPPGTEYFSYATDNVITNIVRDCVKV